MTKITYANLLWTEQDQPLSAAFNDIYFSSLSGLEESRYVFLQHNQLERRFKALLPGMKFVVGETGFGSGLNFLCCWQLFNTVAPIHSDLHFISIEKFPLATSDLCRTLQMFPDLQPLANKLCAHYGDLETGKQHIVFDEGRVCLTLLIGDVSEQLAIVNTEIDAWFLDGFAPAKNPDMWTMEVFRQLARLSTKDTTIATFTSAGFVRRGLTEVGFLVQKGKGFANKREMLYGDYFN